MDERLFLEICKENNYSTEQINLFKGALEFARDKLAQRKRLSGNTYYEHTLRVAEILVQNKAEPQIVVVGLLHSLPKQVDVKRFGEQIIKLLNQVEDLQELKLKHPKLDALALRQIFLTAVRDVRVILVKLASKLDNMRTVNVFSEVEQKRLAGEVLEIYAPLANHLGMDRLKTDLEDVAFKTLNSKKYYQILSFLESSQEQRIKDIAQAIALIKTIAGDKVNIIKIKGRPKHIYSIYKKISRRKVKLHEQYDLLGIRVIVKDIKDCYELLGLLHEKLRSVPGRLKDYIANPKPNFYRSIHTAVLLPDDKRLEIQIRTFEMNEFAETGVAAHWHYKGDKTSESFEKKIAWLRSVLDLQRENKEFLEEVKVDLFGDKIYCYTPKGDVKELPMEATILDFAFMIHEQVGNRAVGGRVNGKFRPLKHKLNSGDVVEILTNKNQRPRRSWIKIVTSAKARQKIRKSLKEHDTLPAFYFRKLKPESDMEEGLLTCSEQYPKAVCSLAKCCRAIPGEDIVGIVTKRRIISVHRPDCRAAKKEETRWVKVAWREEFNQKIRFYVMASERSGLLADLLHTIATAGFEVKEAKAKLLGIDVQCSFLVIPRDLNQLKEMIVRINKVNGVKRIYFD